MRNVLIIGDSLGLPRHNISYVKTWPYLLASSQSSFHFIFKLQRALTTKMLFMDTPQDWLEFYSPKDVIMQVGIVDCAPRYLKNDGLPVKLLAASPSFIRSQVWKLIKKYSKRSAKYADVSLNDYENNLRMYIERCNKANVERIFLIKIARPGSSMVKSNPGVIAQVEAYNKIIEKICADAKNCIVIDELENATDSYFLEDGYHLNENGNELLYRSILKYYN